MSAVCLSVHKTLRRFQWNLVRR